MHQIYESHFSQCVVIKVIPENLEGKVVLSLWQQGCDSGWQTGRRSMQGVGTYIGRYKHRNQKQLNFILSA